MRVAGVAVAAVLALAAGCGGGSPSPEPGSTETAPPVSATTSPGLSVAPDAPALDEDRLPPQDAINGLREGAPRALAGPQAFVDALYQAGDPTKPVAAVRLREAGYSGGVLRDQLGQDPSSGLALLRTYVMRLRDDDAARAEVEAAVEEVRGSTTEPTRDLDLAGIEGARGLRVDVDQNGVRGAVVFVSFAVGDELYGIQAVGRSASAVRDDEIIGAAREHYARLAAAP